MRAGEQSGGSSLEGAAGGTSKAPPSAFLFEKNSARTWPRGPVCDFTGHLLSSGNLPDTIPNSTHQGLRKLLEKQKQFNFMSSWKSLQSGGETYG